jgi:outer membrane protein assembly factor BamA
MEAHRHSSPQPLLACALPPLLRRALAGAVATIVLAWFVPHLARAAEPVPASPPDLARAVEPVPAPHPVASSTVQVELESIRVEPAGREAEILVRRHLPLKVGQVVDPDQLVQARDQLTATGLFDEVDIYTTRGSRPGGVNAVVAAKPSHKFRFETGLGFEPLRGWYLNILGVRRTGLFDRGGIARLSWRSGLRTDGLYGELQVPGVLPNDLDLLFQAEVFTEDWTVYDGDNAYYQTLNRSRVHFGARRRLGADMDLVLRTGFSRVNPAEELKTHDDTPSIALGGLVPTYEKPLHLFDLEGEVHQDHLDRLRPWQKGSWIGCAVRTSAPDEGSPFWGADLDARCARPVAGTRAAAFRFRAAYTDPGTPYFLRPIAGGVGSLRGFAGAGLSGPLGARALWQASAEWRHPLAGDDPRRPRVIGTVFFDMGDHWTSQGRRYGLSANVGYGALFRIPGLDTLNLEVGYPLTREPTRSPVTIGISLGRSF